MLTPAWVGNWPKIMQPEDGKVWEINFNDWMYQLDEKRVLNRAEMSKFGFKVGEVTLWIERKDSL